MVEGDGNKMGLGHFAPNMKFIFESLKIVYFIFSQLVREFKIEYDYGNIESKHLIVNVPNKPLRFRFVDRH